MKSGPGKELIGGRVSAEVAAVLSRIESELSSLMPVERNRPTFRPVFDAA
jgi:hypothetical protein